MSAPGKLVRSSRWKTGPSKGQLPKVATEMALHVLAYNLTRVMNIMGVRPFLAAMGA